jgi:hypothetical protein
MVFPTTCHALIGGEEPWLAHRYQRAEGFEAAGESPEDTYMGSVTHDVIDCLLRYT